MKESKNRSRLTKQIVIDSGLHQLLKIKATKADTTIKELVEGCLAELLEVRGKEI